MANPLPHFCFSSGSSSRTSIIFSSTTYYDASNAGVLSTSPASSHRARCVHSMSSIEDRLLRHDDAEDEGDRVGDHTDGMAQPTAGRGPLSSGHDAVRPVAEAHKKKCLGAAYRRRQLLEAVSVWGAARVEWTLREWPSGVLRYKALHHNDCYVLCAMVTYATERQMTHMLTEALDGACVMSMACACHPRHTVCAMFQFHSDNAAMLPILDALALACKELSRTQWGSLTLMHIMPDMPALHRWRISQDLLLHAGSLMTNEFGNFVVQTVLDTITEPKKNNNNNNKNNKNNVEERDTISDVYATDDEDEDDGEDDEHVHHAIYTAMCDALTGHWLLISCDKYASHVVEKLVRGATCAARALILEELVSNAATLSQLMRDRYGNFVLQAIVMTTEDKDELQWVSSAVKNHLWSCPYSRSISEALRKQRSHLALLQIDK